MIQTYEVTWTETVHYTAEIEIDSTDSDTNSWPLEDAIMYRLYDNIINTDVPNGIENIHYKKL